MIVCYFVPVLMYFHRLYNAYKWHAHSCTYFVYCCRFKSKRSRLKSTLVIIRQYKRGRHVFRVNLFLKQRTDKWYIKKGREEWNFIYLSLSWWKRLTSSIISFLPTSVGLSVVASNRRLHWTIVPALYRRIKFSYKRSFSLLCFDLVNFVSGIIFFSQFKCCFVVCQWAIVFSAFFWIVYMCMAYLKNNKTYLPCSIGEYKAIWIFEFFSRRV